MSTNTLEQVQDLTERLVEFSESPQSRGYYQKAILQLGIGRVEEAMGEVRMRLHEGKIEDKARYLTTLLKDWMLETDIVPTSMSVEVNGPTKNLPLFDVTDLTERQGQQLEGEIKQLTVPYSTKVLQWARPITNDFFALEPLKEQFDEVETRIMINGEIVKVRLIRGKRSLLDDPKGILTVEHARVLAAIEHLWAREKAIYEIKHGKPLLTCTVRLRDIGTILGMKNIGGRDLKRIATLLYDLERSGYYFDVSKHSIRQDLEFKFLGLVNITTIERPNGGRESICQFYFSDSYSKLFLQRNVVSRPLTMLHVDSPIAFKLYQHLYPILVKREQAKPYKVSLLALITILKLPPATWHRYKSLRKQNFARVVAALQNKETTDERQFEIGISGEKADDDYFITARLIAK